MDSDPASPDEAREVLRNLGMSDEIETLDSKSGRYDIEIPTRWRETIESEGSYSEMISLEDDREGEIYLQDIP